MTALQLLLARIAEKHTGEPGSDARRKLVLAACECARLALPHVPEGDERPLRAIEAAERWGHGEDGMILDAIRDIYEAAYAYAATDLVAYDAAYTAYGAVMLANTSAVNVEIYLARVTAKVAAACGAGANDPYATRDDVFRQCVDIWRKHYPEEAT